MKKIRLMAAIMLLAATCSITSFAGTWQKNDIGYWWQNDDGSYPVNSWQWLDGNNDGISEMYYFDSNGYCLLNTTAPDGQTVNENGALIINGIVQTQTASTVADNSNGSAGGASNSGSIKKDSAAVSGISTSPYDGYTIVVNMSTKKYHTNMKCTALSKMNDENKGYASNASYLNANGYSHCKLCDR